MFVVLDYGILGLWYGCGLCDVGFFGVIVWNLWCWWVCVVGGWCVGRVFVLKCCVLINVLCLYVVGMWFGVFCFLVVDGL